MNNPYEELVREIILQTVKDYRLARKRLRHHPKKKEANLMIDDCERFFRSDWFTALTMVDGDMILRKLKEEEG